MKVGLRSAPKKGSEKALHAFNVSGIAGTK